MISDSVSWFGDSAAPFSRSYFESVDEDVIFCLCKAASGKSRIRRRSVSLSNDGSVRALVSIVGEEAAREVASSTLRETHMNGGRMCSMLADGLDIQVGDRSIEIKRGESVVWPHSQVTCAPSVVDGAYA